MRIIKILVFIIIADIQVFAQTENVSKKIETGNWLDLEATILDENDESVSFQCVMQMPEFPGGYDSLAVFLSSKLIYPKAAIKDSISGKVMTSFVIDHDGKVKDIQTIQSVRFDLDSTCVSALLAMPKWSTIKSTNQQKLAVRFFLPVRFTLKKNKNN